MLILGILLVYISLVDGCGISTHTEIVWRALDKLRSVQYKSNHTQTIIDILERNPDALQAGGPFPDAFYNSLCYQGRYHSESEDTHWGLFLQVSLEYIKTEYPSLDQRSEKIIAFLFGIISHQVADITWHSLKGLKQGFIPALAALNFRGDFNAAHDFADVAGDMIGVYEWNVTDYATQWFIPTQDLINIYQNYYGESILTEEIIDACGGMLLAGRLGEQVIGKLLYPEMVLTAPAMLDDLRNYFLGGLDDMATWTAIIWEQAAIAIFNGTEGCTIPANTLGFTCTENSSIVWSKLFPLGSNIVHQSSSIIEKYSAVYRQNIGMEKDGTGTKVKLTNFKNPEIRFSENDNLQDKIYPPHTLELVEEEKTAQSHQFLHSSIPYSTFGKVMVSADLDQDENMDLVVGAPGREDRGCIYIFLDVEETGTGVAEEQANTIICNPGDRGRFGSSLLILDINQDEILDIVVGDPYAGAELLEYSGRVYIFSGSFNDNNTLSYHLTDVLDCEEKFANFGSYLFKGDVDKDGTEEILISAPYSGRDGIQRGALYIYSTNLKNYTILEGSRDYERFGSSVALSSEYLVVSSPFYRICWLYDCTYHENDLQSAGAFTVFSLRPNLDPRQKTRVQGTMEFGCLGAELDFRTLNIHGRLQEVLVVGESSAASESGDLEQTGRINIYSFNQTGSELVLNNLARMSGESESGRFGQVVSGFGEGLVVSAPYLGNSLYSYGKVYVYDGFTELPAGDISSHCGFYPTPCPGNLASLVLTEYLENSLFGSSLNTFQGKQQTRILIIGSERSNVNGRLSGSIYFYKI